MRSSTGPAEAGIDKLHRRSNETIEPDTRESTDMARPLLIYCPDSPAFTKSVDPPMPTIAQESFFGRLEYDL